MTDPAHPANGLPEVPDPGAPAEPLVSTAGMVAAAVAIIALLTAFGVPVDNDQQAAILGVIAVAAPLLVAARGRSRVFSPYTVRRMVVKAREGRL